MQELNAIHNIVPARVLNGDPEPDHLFYNDAGPNCDSGKGNDIWLTLISDMGTDGVTIESECD